MCEPRNRGNGASDIWTLTAYSSQSHLHLAPTNTTFGSGPYSYRPHTPILSIWALVQFRTGPMTEGIKRYWCMHSTMVCVWLCALFRQASARCKTALAPVFEGDICWHSICVHCVMYGIGQCNSGTISAFFAKNVFSFNFTVYTTKYSNLILIYILLAWIFGST